MNKITVIGSGSVGSTIAYTLTTAGVASEILLIDINNEKALGEALDIRQGISFVHPCTIHAGGYADAVGSDLVIITSGIPRKSDQSRQDLAQVNVTMLKSIAPEIVKYAPNATYIIVSNPVDIMTYAFCKYSGIPEERVIGSGTVLDTSRLRARLAEDYSINEKNVHAYVLGEHGDTAFVPWSLANISNISVEKYASCIQHPSREYPVLNRAEVEEYVKKSGAQVIRRKGATFYAIAMSVVHLCKCLLSGTDTTLTVSTMLHGEYGIDDVCLSVLTLVSNKEARSKILLPLNDEELAALHKSADYLKGMISQINI